MEFGADFSNYESLNANLPDDAPTNKSVLANGTGFGSFFWGMSKWGDKTWIGKLYDPEIKENNLLDEYIKHYNSIELNATSYQIYSPLQVKKWADKADGYDFLFCPKIPRFISIKKDPMADLRLTDQFIIGIREFGAHLGPIFLQLNERFQPDDLSSLLGYLALLPRDLQFFVEVRHPDWFTNKHLWPHFTNGLRKFGVGLVITDTPGRRDVLHMELTVPKLFLRFVGKGSQPKDDERFKKWVERINNWKGLGLTEAFIFLHLHDDNQILTFSEKVRRMLMTT